MKPIKSQDYYEMLGVPRHATQDDIRRAFDLCRHTYQDDSLATYSLFSEEENKELLSLMEQAYEILKDPGSRKEYDSYLSQKEGRPNSANEGERMVASMIGVGGGSSKVPSPRMRKAENVSAPPAPSRSRGRGAKPAKVRKAEDADEREEKFIASVQVFTGPVLKKFRTLKGVSLEDLSEQTKIRKTYLRYLEEEEYEFLPAPIYIKGFITIVANFLGLPAQRTADDYMAQYRSRQNAE